MVYFYGMEQTHTTMSNTQEVNAVILVNGEQILSNSVFATYTDAKKYRDSRFQDYMSSDKFVYKRSHGSSGIGICMADDCGNHIHETWKIVRIHITDDGEVVIL